RPMTALLPLLPTTPAEAAAPPPFGSAGEALLWATEVLRRRRLPRNSGTLAERVALAPAQQQEAALAALNLGQEASQVAAHWGQRFRPNLPHDAAGRLSLALQIEQALQQLPAAPQQLLRLWAWGDWTDEARLNAALAHQEKLRRQGIRVRLSYRYSAAQLALLAGVSKATLWRRLHAALGLLEGPLVQCGVVATATAPTSVRSTHAIPVRRAAFGKG
ncbi:MAG: hypothetical protein INF43_00620, partial [Alphaproteobacteria bacterium]|nr:hypothetical protein [Alphaproteobacteria bacterium]